jgi:hypothetical protein
MKMRKSMLFLFVIAFIGVLFFNSCKKCKRCQCWNDGKVKEITNCAYGFPPATMTLNAREYYLREEVGYDSVLCVME